MKLGTLPVTSNRQDWNQTFEVIDEESGTAIDLSGLSTITIAVRDPTTKYQRLTGTLADGHIALVDSNTKFDVIFRATEMYPLEPQLYEVGCIITSGSDTQEAVIGYLPVLDGVYQSGAQFP